MQQPAAWLIHWLIDWQNIDTSVWIDCCRYRSLSLPHSNRTHSRQFKFNYNKSISISISIISCPAFSNTKQRTATVTTKTTSTITIIKYFKLSKCNATTTTTKSATKVKIWNFHFLSFISFSLWHFDCCQYKNFLYVFRNFTRDLTN